MTEDQCHAIIDFMSAHPLFAANTSMGCDPNRTKDKLGERLTNLVNEKSPAKTTKQVLDVSICYLPFIRLYKIHLLFLLTIKIHSFFTEGLNLNFNIINY